MTNPKLRVRDRLSVIAQAPRVKHGVALIRKTILPPTPHSRRNRMAVATAVLAGLGAAGYVGTGSVGWAILLLVVGVPVAVLPSLLIIGMLLEAREARADALLAAQGTTHP